MSRKRRKNRNNRGESQNIKSQSSVTSSQKTETTKTKLAQNSSNGNERILRGHKQKAGILSVKNSVPIIQPSSLQKRRSGKSANCIPFGSDNLLPYAIAHLCRVSPVHRGIINKKVEFIAGPEWTTENEDLRLTLQEINADGEDFTDVLKKVSLDDLSGGVAYVEMVTNRAQNYVNFYHHDWTKCRLSKDKKSIGISANWRDRNPEVTEIPIYPRYKEEKGLRRSMMFIKSYEPEFVNYGIADWISGLNVVAIGHKTDTWNLSRIDASFQPSGVFMLNGIDDDEEGESTVEYLENEYGGPDNAGKVIFISVDGTGDSAKFIPLDVNFDADWTSLDQNSITKLITAHSWYRSLMSLPDSTGFNTERILNEWRMANKTTVMPKQRDYIRPFKRMIKDVINLDVTDLKFVNKPPVKEEKPLYMRIWEARREDGLDYDPNDKLQQRFLSELKVSNKK